MDRLLATALTVYEDGLCPGCGHPRSRTLDDETIEGEFEVEEHHCEACATRERYAAEGQDQKPRPGQKIVVRDLGAR